jgi:hypothetical protein
MHTAPTAKRKKYVTTYGKVNKNKLKKYKPFD